MRLLFITLVSGDWVPEQHMIHNSQPIEKSVAIIGGGAAGTSTAFWLSNVLPNVKTTLYEKSNYLGGRSTTVKIKDDERWGTIELGASIFVEANKNLMKATEVFGLNRTDKETQETSRPRLGIWDGNEFLFQETGTYWDKITPIWRYGILSPLKFQQKQKEVVKEFMKLYEDHEGFETMEKMIESLNYQNLVNQTAIEYLKSLGINDKFSNEVLQSGTRGNYCQDLNRLHPFALMVSMEAGHGTWAVESGNFRIFEEFASRSGANVQLETEVTAIHNVTKLDSTGAEIQRYLVQTTKGDQLFDQVVVSSPLALSGIQFDFPVEDHHREYHTVHVTLVAGHVNPTYFKKEIQNLPTFIITTGYPLVQHFENNQATFQTFSVHRFLENGENVIKIFSSKIMTDQDLEPLFLNSSWVYRKEWLAFPELSPVSTFPHFVLKAEQEDQSGIIYTGAFENFISTMETQTVSGKNAARLIYNKWCHHRYCQPFGDGWGDY